MPLTITERSLGLGEWALSADPIEVLTCLGLGSCVAIALYDPVARVGAMAHMVLPDSSLGRVSTAAPAKFVDLAVPLVVGAMLKRGAERMRMQASLIGGASMLESASRSNTMQIGERNAVAARAAAAEARIRVREEHLGGTHGRTVRLAIGTGAVEITTAGVKQ